MIPLNQNQKLVSSYIYYVILKILLLFSILYLIFSLFHMQTVIIFWFATMGLPVIIYEWLYSNNFDFRLTDDNLIIDKGVIFKKTKIIPYSNIQTVDVNKGFLRRWLKIATVNIWTASPNQLNLKTANKPDGWIMLKIDKAEWLAGFVSSYKSKN
ncbi:MAG: PH domain-containing protein [Candidatus Paceibacterota bacterium]